MSHNYLIPIIQSIMPKVIFGHVIHQMNMHLTEVVASHRLSFWNSSNRKMQFLRIQLKTNINWSAYDQDVKRFFETITTSFFDWRVVPKYHRGQSYFHVAPFHVRYHRNWTSELYVHGKRYKTLRRFWETFP